jgi:hypothetical protein
MRHERPVRSDRVQFGGRNRDRNQEQNAEGGERAERGDRPERGDRQPRFGFDRNNRERPRFEQRRDRDREREPAFGAEQPGAPEGGAALPAFITAPVPRPGAASESPASDAGEERPNGGRGGFAMNPRRRSRAPREEAASEGTATAAGELPLGE